MRAEDADTIRSLPVFRNIREATFAAITKVGLLEWFSPGVTLIRENAPAERIHIVVEGTVETFATVAGRETAIDIVQPAAAYLIPAFPSDRDYAQSARTLKRSHILMIPRERARPLMERDPALMRAIVAEYSRAYRRTVEDLKHQRLLNAAERVANWLLRADQEQGGAGRVKIGCAKGILASRLGMTPENLSRAFTALRDLGVQVKGSWIELTQPATLLRYIGADPPFFALEYRSGSAAMAAADATSPQQPLSEPRPALQLVDVAPRNGA
jgi:CRP/FNR family transcriptional activator FtrB